MTDQGMERFSFQGDLGKIHGVRVVDEKGPVAAITIPSWQINQERGQATVIIHVRESSGLEEPYDSCFSNCRALNGLTCHGEAMSVPGLLHRSVDEVAARLEGELTERLSFRQR